MSKDGKGHLCSYCRRRLQARGTRRSKLAATKDHVLPKHTSQPTYTVWCCQQCNQLKGGMLPEAWSKFMRENPEWWRTK